MHTHPTQHSKQAVLLWSSFSTLYQEILDWQNKQPTQHPLIFATTLTIFFLTSSLCHSSLSYSFLLLVLIFLHTLAPSSILSCPEVYLADVCADFCTATYYSSSRRFLLLASHFPFSVRRVGKRRVWIVLISFALRVSLYYLHLARVGGGLMIASCSLVNTMSQCRQNVQPCDL